MNNKSVFTAAVIGLITVVPQAVLAETKRRALEEVIVTAQKTAQSSQDVPISISAFDGDFMKDIGATNLQDIAAFIPNLQFSSDTDPALAQINIRGFGTNPLNAAFENSVGFVQDEIAFGRPGYFSESIFDIGRIEVLRGPQGTLFGKNTVAGVFNVTSAAPTDEFSGDVRLSFSDPKERRLEFGVSGAVTDKLTARVAGLDYRKQGETENTKRGDNTDFYDQQALRLKFLYEAADNLRFDVTASDSVTASHYWPLQLHLLDQGTRDFLEDFDPEVEDDPFNKQLSQDAPGFLDKGSTTVSLKTDWDISDDLTATLVLGQSELYIDSLVDLDASPADIARLAVFSEYDQDSVELRFSGGNETGLFGLGQSVQFVAGAFYFTSTFDQLAQIITGEDFGDYLTTDDAAQLGSGSTNTTTGVGAVPGLGALVGTVTAGAIGDDRYLLDYLLEIEATSFFGQFTWQLNDQWAITPGIRFNRERKEADAIGQGACAGKATGSPCVIETALSAQDYNASGLTRTETDVSPKLSVQYFPNEDLTVFFTWAKGFKSGGFNGSSFSGDDLVFEEESAQTYELGAKGFYFENTLELNVTLFRTELDNLQVLAFNGAFFDVTNAASAFSQGIELDFKWLTPLEFLSVFGSAALLEAEYEEYSNAPAPVSDGLNSTQDLEGETVALAPEASVSLSPTVTLPINDSLGILASIDILHQGEQFSDTDLDPETRIPANTTFGGRISLGAQDKSWAFTIGGSNLTDKKVANQILDTVFFPGSYYVSQKGGRKVFAAVTFSW